MNYRGDFERAPSSLVARAPEPKRENWPRIFDELIAAGFSIYSLHQFVADRTARNYARRTVENWRDGKSEPHHYAACWLLWLHAQNVPHETSGKNTLTPEAKSNV